MVSLSVIFITACGNGRVEKEGGDVKEYLEEYAMDYEVIKEENNKKQLKIKAPDFPKVITVMSKDGEEKEIRKTDLEEAVKDYPEYKKEYIIWVEDTSQEQIEEQFLQEVSKELIIEAIKDIEYTEQWGAGE